MTRRDPSLKAGDLFQNQFEIRALLGAGGHAHVYRALDQIMGREVALKLIEIPAGSENDRRRRARLEAQVLSKLDHPNIVRVFGAGATTDDWIYLVMELLHGRSLREAMQEHRSLLVAEALSIGEQIAIGVHAAHRAGTVHRDLKPENVFLEAANNVRVIDFGVAKFEAPEAQTTQRDLIQGTLYYMSPEHLQGFGVTPRSDVFALGVTLYEMLAGVRPALVGLQEINPNAVMYHQIYRMPPALNELSTDIPEFVARTVQRMLAKNPIDRFQGMDEVASVLGANLDRFRTQAGPTASQIRDLSTPASPIVEAASAAQDTVKEERLALAITRPLTSPADSPAAPLPSSGKRNAENDPPAPTSSGDLARVAATPSPAGWSAANSSQRRPRRRWASAAMVLGGAAALGLTALSLRERSERTSGSEPIVATPLTASASPPPAAAAAQPPAAAPAELDPTPSVSATGQASNAKAIPAPEASISKASIATRNARAELPSSGLGRPHARRQQPVATPLPQFGPEDIR